MILYHGSPISDIKKLVFDKKYQRTNQLVSGDGIYFTDSKEVAKSYAVGGSVYEVTFDGHILDATKESSFLDLLRNIESKYNLLFINTPYLMETIDQTVNGSYSIREFGQSIKVILENDDKILSQLEDYEITEEIKNEIDKMINSFDCIKYIDKGIDDGNSVVYLVLNNETITILNEHTL